METTAATPVAPASAGGFSDAGNAGSRYDALLRQIVQLNTDLQKTVALSQTLQRERDDTQQLNVKLRGDLKRLQERCDKLQLVLMQETEQKIDSDKKHEELIAKWKKQLEVKARAFESLQKKFAPPRDLEQLRIKIQEEMEGPYQQRINSLQDEVERHRQISFDMRREFEALKTEYEQYSINQLQLAEDAAANSQHTENIRRLEQQREAAQIEIKALRDEVRDVREELQRVSEHTKEEALRQCQDEAEETTHKLQMEKESMQKVMQALESEKEVMVAKQTSSHELKMSNLKEMRSKKSDSQAQLAGLQRETRAALSKTLRELSKTQKKRDAYKRKCLEIHENYKQLVEETNRREAKLLQSKKEHTAELQQLLAQLSEAESDKTALMQRQIELGFPPPSAFTQKTSVLRSTEPAQA
eukprot:jgi/Phyca11/16126/fgenesh1_pg.PHYCAscaffold_18_\